MLLKKCLAQQQKPLVKWAVTGSNTFTSKALTAHMALLQYRNKFCYPFYKMPQPQKSSPKSFKSLLTKGVYLWHALRPFYCFKTFKNPFMPTIQMTTQDFKDKIFDYEASETWQYKGDKPAIIDFYADWCGPCKAVAPVLEELSETYKGQVDIYKLDTDKEQELSALFGIQSIPTFLFIPKEGAPMMQKGALPKNAFTQVIEERLLQGAEKNEE